MKTKQFFGLAFSGLSILIGTSYVSMAGTETGNGGKGMREGNTIYLLDLYEQGIEKNPYFENPNRYEDREVTKIVSHIAISEATAKLVSSKLVEIETRTPLYAAVLDNLLRRYNWVLRDARLNVTSDSHSSINLNRNGIKLVQLAVREGSQITIDLSYWNQMNERNQAALIFHELNYALDDAFAEADVVSDPARAITGGLFKRGIINGNFQQFLADSQMGLTQLSIGDGSVMEAARPNGGAVYVSQKNGYLYFGVQQTFGAVGFPIPTCNADYIVDTQKHMTRRILKDGREVQIDDTVPSFTVYFGVNDATMIHIGSCSTLFKEGHLAFGGDVDLVELHPGHFAEVLAN